MSNALGNSGGRLYSFASQPVLIDCNFVVDRDNVNGLGIRELRGQGVQSVYMATSASFVGTTHTGTNVIDSISSTANLVVGMHVATLDLPAGAVITAISSSTAITVSIVATTGHAAATITYTAVGSPMVNSGVSSASNGLAWVHLRHNYNRFLGDFSTVAAPANAGGVANIDAGSAALTVGQAYRIATVGVGPAGVATISPVADSSGSLASKYFMLYDSYGNAFCIYIVVNGVGSPPNLGPALSPAQLAAGARGLSYHQLTLATGATAATQTTALSTLINALPSGIAGTFSFTTSGGGGATLTVTSTLNAPLAGIPQDGSGVIPANNSVPLPIYFTISTGSATAGSVWTDGSGNLYTVDTTLVAGTTLKTSGTQAPVPAAGTLTYVSGSGATTALTYSAAVAGLATGYSFALTVSDTNLQDWAAVGLPAGVAPVVGASFIATATGAGGSTGTVYPLSVSGVSDIEILGDPNKSIAPQPVGGSAHQGAWILVQFLGASFAAGAYTPAGTVSSHTHSFTPAGSISAGNIAVAAGTAGDAVTNNAGVLNSTGGQDLTVDAQTFTGSAGTTGATAPTFTGTAASLTGTVTLARVAPAEDSVVYMSFYVDAKFSPSNDNSH